MRVHATGNNLTHTPVVFIARQREDGIVSWTIPQQPQGCVDNRQYWSIVKVLFVDFQLCSTR